MKGKNYDPKNFKCKKHPNQDCSFYCKDDKVFFCVLCVGDHQPHKFLTIPQMEEEIKSKLDDMKKNMIEKQGILKPLEKRFEDQISRWKAKQGEKTQFYGLLSSRIELETGKCASQAIENINGIQKEIANTKNIIYKTIDMIKVTIESNKECQKRAFKSYEEEQKDHYIVLNEYVKKIERPQKTEDVNQQKFDNYVLQYGMYKSEVNSLKERITAAENEASEKGNAENRIALFLGTFSPETTRKVGILYSPALVGYLNPLGRDALLYDFTQMKSYKKPVFQKHIHIDGEQGVYVPKKLDSLETMCIHYGYDSVMYDSRMFFMGGSVDLTKNSDETYEYLYDREVVYDRAKLLEARKDHACCILNGILYCVGGDGNEGLIKTTESLNVSNYKYVEAKNWKNEKGQLNEAKSQMVLSVMEASGNIYCFGGELEEDLTNLIERAHPNKNNLLDFWEKIPYVNDKEALPKVHSPGIIHLRIQMTPKGYLEEFLFIGGINSIEVDMESKFVSKDIYVVIILDGKAKAKKLDITLEQPDYFAQRKPYVKFMNIEQKGEEQIKGGISQILEYAYIIGNYVVYKFFTQIKGKDIDIKLEQVAEEQFNPFSE